MKIKNSFYNLADMLPPFENLLLSVPKNIADTALEIRVRAGKPVIIETISERYICGTRCADTDEIYACIKHFCSYSIHSCQRELSEGWITLKGGHRAGFTGTAVIKNGVVETIKDISSINLRISREHKGISDLLFSKTAFNRDFRGLIIAGAPLSGKTTMLRDFCRNLGAFHKISMVDEKGEIAASYMGVPQNDVGMNTDVLDCFPKDKGIEQAIRAMSPEFVICDEIGNDADTLIKYAGNGVKPVITAHCRDINEALHNMPINRMILSGAANYIAFLGNGKFIGNLKGLWCIENGKGIDSCDNSNNLLYDRNSCICGNENTYSSA